MTRYARACSPPPFFLYTTPTHRFRGIRRAVDGHQVQYEVKRKLVEVSMRDRRKQQMKERDQMAIDLEAFKEK